MTMRELAREPRSRYHCSGAYDKSVLHIHADESCRLLKGNEPMQLCLGVDLFCSIEVP